MKLWHYTPVVLFYNFLKFGRFVFREKEFQISFTKILNIFKTLLTVIKRKHKGMLKKSKKQFQQFETFKSSLQANDKQT